MVPGSSIDLPPREPGLGVNAESTFIPIRLIRLGTSVPFRHRANVALAVQNISYSLSGRPTPAVVAQGIASDSSRWVSSIYIAPCVVTSPGHTLATSCPNLRLIPVYSRDASRRQRHIRRCDQHSGMSSILTGGSIAAAGLPHGLTSAKINPESRGYLAGGDTTWTIGTGPH